MLSTGPLTMTEYKMVATERSKDRNVIISNGISRDRYKAASRTNWNTRK